MDINETFRHLRDVKGFTQKEMAKRLAISQSYLSLVESGAKSPSNHLIERLGDICGMPVPVIMFLSLSESDIPDHKKELYRGMKPIIRSMIEMIFDNVNYYLED